MLLDIDLTEWRNLMGEWYTDITTVEVSSITAGGQVHRSGGAGVREWRARAGVRPEKLPLKPP